MYPLLVCSLVIWAVILERFITMKRVSRDLEPFHLEAMNLLLRDDFGALRDLCKKRQKNPVAVLLGFAIERMESNEPTLKKNWRTALERRRSQMNLELKRNLWVLGTIGSSAPFIGLFGTVVGILKTFSQMAKTGSGGFAVVAAGISEALIATAAGIVVAVIAVMAFNAFQTQWNRIVLDLRVYLEESAEILSKRNE